MGDDFKESEFHDRDKSEFGGALGAGIDELGTMVGSFIAGGVEQVLALRADFG